jgi:hypothetical protein
MGGKSDKRPGREEIGAFIGVGSSFCQTTLNGSGVIPVWGVDGLQKGHQADGI